jgi:poly(A) polymerase
LLRCQSGEVEAELGTWWEEFQHASDERRAEMLLPDTGGPKKRRRRNKKPGASVQADLPID